MKGPWIDTLLLLTTKAWQVVGLKYRGRVGVLSCSFEIYEYYIRADSYAFWLVNKLPMGT